MIRATATAALLLILTVPAFADQSAVVIRIVDGDTFVCKNYRGETHVRLIGVYAPEKYQPGGAEATAALGRLLPVGAHVTLKFDGAPTHNLGRLMAYVFAGDVFVNIEMLRSGLAETSNKYPFARHDEFNLAELEARLAGIGIWSQIVCATSAGGGSKFHPCDCNHLTGHAFEQLPRGDAKSFGLEPCARFGRARATRGVSPIGTPQSPASTTRPVPASFLPVRAP